MAHLVRARLALGALLSLLSLSAPMRVQAVSDAADELQVATSLTPNLEHGAQLFEMCAACHGRDGTGAADGSVPAIAGQPARVLVKQIVNFRHEARIDIRMAHFVDHRHLGDPQQLADVTAYVSSLAPRVPNASGEPSRAGTEGAGLYARECERCHGPSAEPDARAGVPRLAGQHEEYLTRQLADALEGRRPAMGRDHARILQPLSEAQRAALASYLSQLRTAPTAGPPDRR